MPINQTMPLEEADATTPSRGEVYISEYLWTLQTQGRLHLEASLAGAIDTGRLQVCERCHFLKEPGACDVCSSLPPPRPATGRPTTRLPGEGGTRRGAAGTGGDLWGGPDRERERASRALVMAETAGKRNGEM